MPFSKWSIEKLFKLILFLFSINNWLILQVGFIYSLIQVISIAIYYLPLVIDISIVLFVASVPPIGPVVSFIISNASMLIIFIFISNGPPGMFLIPAVVALLVYTCFLVVCRFVTIVSLDLGLESIIPRIIIIMALFLLKV